MTKVDKTELMRLERDGPVGILRFLQSDKRNPYSIAFAEELVTQLHAAERDDTIRAVVMTGGDHFSSGGDLVGFQSEITKGARATSEMIDEVHEGGRAAYRFRKPLISAVCGVAYGAGLSLALSADIVVAAEDARLCEVFARVGGCPDTGSSWLLQQRVSAGWRACLCLPVGRSTVAPPKICGLWKNAFRPIRSKHGRLKPPARLPDIQCSEFRQPSG